MNPSERDRLAAGVAPEKWKVMTREQKRQALAEARRQDRRSQRRTTRGRPESS